MQRSVSRRAVLLAVFGLILILSLAGCASAPTLALSSVPDRTEYAFGEELDLVGGKLRLTLPDGAVEIPMTDEAVTYSGYDPFVPGDQEITVYYTFGETVLSAAFFVTVAERVVRETGIRIAEPPDRTEYVEGQAFEPGGIRVFIAYEDGTERVLNDGYAFSVGDRVTLRDNGAVEVRYRDFTATFYLSVVKREKLGLKCSAPPERTAYAAGDAPSLSGAEFAYFYNDGSEEPAPDAAAFTVTPERLFFGTETIAVSDGTDSVSIPVSVEKRTSKKNLVRETEAMLEKIRTGAALSNREAFFSFPILKTETVSIGGETFRLDEPTPELALSNADYGSVLTDIAFRVDRDSQTGERTLGVYLLCLLSYGKRELAVETDNDKFVLTLSERPATGCFKVESPGEFGSETELRYVFDAPTNENAVVIAAKRNGPGFTVKLFYPVRSEDETYVVSGAFDNAVFWWNASPCEETGGKRAQKAVPRYVFRKSPLTRASLENKFESA